MRLQISKSKNAESFYIVESTYINGKRSNRIVEKLGALEEIKENIGDEVDPYEWGRNRAKYLIKLKKDGILPDVVLNFSPSNIIDSNVPASFNCGYLFLQKIYYQLGINKICKDISKDFKFSNFVVCTDAGLSSNDNRIFNSMVHRFFVTSQSIKKLKGYLKDWALDSKGWSLLGSKSSFDLASIDESIHYNDVFFKERWINDNGIEQRLCVTFFIKYRDYQASILSFQYSNGV